MSPLALAATHGQFLNDEASSPLTVGEVKTLINYEKPIIVAMQSLNWLNRPRMIIALLRIARELQGKNLLTTPTHTITYVMSQALKEIDWPANDLDKDAMALTQKFLEFIR
jgi:hypothetical protein